VTGSDRCSDPEMEPEFAAFRTPAIVRFSASSSVAFVRARLPNERIGAIGASLGGAAALLGPHPLPVNALVFFESVYPDIASLVPNANKIGAPTSAT
jgi:dienelactone hydrolase